MEGAADFFDDDDGSKMDVEGADDDDDAGTYGDEGTEARVMFKETMGKVESTHDFFDWLLRRRAKIGVAAFDSVDYNSMLDKLSEKKRALMAKALAAHLQVRPSLMKTNATARI